MFFIVTVRCSMFIAVLHIIHKISTFLVICGWLIRHYRYRDNISR